MIEKDKNPLGRVSRIKFSKACEVNVKCREARILRVKYQNLSSLCDKLKCIQLMFINCQNPKNHCTGAYMHSNMSCIIKLQFYFI